MPRDCERCALAGTSVLGEADEQKRRGHPKRARIMELPTASDADLPPAAVSTGVLDPGAAVFAELERGMAGMIEQHTAWLELCAAGQRGEEYDWRTAELLSCLRSIEWDLQDLEDHLSIVEGNRQKFVELEDSLLDARKAMVESVRRKIDAVRGTVQEAASSEGHVVARAKATSALAAALLWCSAVTRRPHVCTP